MRILFILPNPAPVPVGGFLVVYEYANRLAARGHKVTVVHVHPTSYMKDPPISSTLRGLAIFVARYFGFKGGYRPDAWFQVDPRVRLKWLPSLHPRWLPDSDVAIATSWGPAEWVSRYPKEKGHKFYLIQHQESIFPNVDPTRVMNTWRLPLKKIVVAKWLQDLATELGESAIYIPNGLDFDSFGIDIPISNRDPRKLIMLYHPEEWKGSKEGLQAMRLARQEIPQLRATLFGFPKKPQNLPGWISYSRTPTRDRLRALYNEAAIFVGPSWSEGWGLPGCEAAQCGAALCVTDNGGHREFAIHNHTALLSPPKDVTALAANIVNLIHNDTLRTRIAKQGHAYVQRLTWARSTDAFEYVLQQECLNQ